MGESEKRLTFKDWRPLNEGELDALQPGDEVLIYDSIGEVNPTDYVIRAVVEARVFKHKRELTGIMYRDPIKPALNWAPRDRIGCHRIIDRDFIHEQTEYDS